MENRSYSFLIEVCGWLEDSDIRNVMLVSQDWYTHTKNERVWQHLCHIRRGVITKPFNIDTWFEFYRVLGERVANESNMVYMVQQFEREMDSISEICEQSRRQQEARTPRVLKRRSVDSSSHKSTQNSTSCSPIPSLPQLDSDEERDGITVRSSGEVLIEEERATFVDATYDEDFVLRRLSSSPTATAVLSPCRVKVIPTNQRASSEPSLSTFRQLQTPEKPIVPHPILKTPPFNTEKNSESSQLDVEDEEEEEEEEETKTPSPVPPPEETAEPVYILKDATPPQQPTIRGGSPVARVYEGTSRRLRQPRSQPTAPRYMDKDAHEDHLGPDTYPMTLEKDEDVVLYAVEQFKYLLNRENVSERLLAVGHHLSREVSSLMSKYNHQVEISEKTKEALEEQQIKNAKLISKNVAVSSRLDESKRWVRKLKETIAENKVSNLPLHNKILKARISEENAAREEAKQQADRFIAQRAHWIAELQENSNKTIALKQTIADMQKQHEADLQTAVEEALLRRSPPSSDENAVSAHVRHLEAQNTALRTNIQGLQALIQNCYITNQELKGRCMNETKVVEDLVEKIQVLQQMNENILQDHERERQKWDHYEEKWVQHEEKYILQISALQRALQQQQRHYIHDDPSTGVVQP